MFMQLLFTILACVRLSIKCDVITEEYQLIDKSETLGITDDSSAFGGYWGSLAVNDHYVVVGAAERGGDNGTKAVGSVSVFQRNKTSGSKYIKEIIPFDGDAFYYFGSTVAVNDDYLLVGAGGHGNFSGAVYIYSLNNLSFKQILFADNPQAHDLFGRAIDINDNHEIVVGAIGRNGNTGIAFTFVYRNGSWSFQQELLPDDLAKNDNFGISVAITKKHVVIGASYQRGDQGSVYIYDKLHGEWMLHTKLHPDVPWETHFGNIVKVQGERDGQERLVIGANGAVYIYEIHVGIDLHVITGERSNRFGSTIALLDDVIVIGALYSDVRGVSRAGMIHVYKLNSNGTWEEKYQLAGSNHLANDSLGASVAIHKNFVFSGNYGSIVFAFNIEPTRSSSLKIINPMSTTIACCCLMALYRSLHL